MFRWFVTGKRGKIVNSGDLGGAGIREVGQHSSPQIDNGGSNRGRLELVSSRRQETAEDGVRTGLTPVSPLRAGPAEMSPGPRR